MVNDNWIKHTITEIYDHPNANALDVLKIDGWDTIVRKGQFKVGDEVVYVKPDTVLPVETVNALGVEQYLRSAVFPGESEKRKCRVTAARLRSVASYGLVCDPKTFFLNGGDHCQHWSPPVQCGRPGDIIPEHPAFLRYTKIKHYQTMAQKFPWFDEPVVVTEKIHGSNIRFAKINGELMLGNHNCQIASEHSQWTSVFTQNIKNLLRSIGGNVVIYGEIFGPRIQDMDYGQPIPTVRVFDICVDGRYLNWSDVRRACVHYEVPTVPVLFNGIITEPQLYELVTGPTTIAKPGEIRCRFKGREGIVIKALQERWPVRMISKLVSADYYAKG